MTDPIRENPPLIGLEQVSRTFQRTPVAAERLLALLGRKALPPALRAVTDVSLDIPQGEVLGLVGESGCGKSTLGRMVAGILSPSAGRVLFDGRPAAELRGRSRLDYVLGVQMIFQDPYASLNPRQKIGDMIAEPLRVHRMAAGEAEIRERVDRALVEVGLDPSYKDRYPHQFSGGQRQRIGIARAFIVGPRFLVCDEPIAALDVSIQAQVINLFMDLRQSHGLTYLFISHDLSVVRHIADRVAIMYLGRLVELAPAADLFAAPVHPYTRALLAEMPSSKRRRRRYRPIAGELPSPLDPPPGCPFHPRCPFALPRCRTELPVLRSAASGRLAACHLLDQA